MRNNKSIIRIHKGTYYTNILSKLNKTALQTFFCKIRDILVENRFVIVKIIFQIYSVNDTLASKISLRRSFRNKDKVSNIYILHRLRPWCTQLLFDVKFRLYVSILTTLGANYPSHITQLSVNLNFSMNNIR